MLAAWFMLKYPHLASGALAASAPVDLYPGEKKEKTFFDAGMDVYGTYGSLGCESRLRTALVEAAAFAGTPDGREVLSETFKTCQPLETPLDGVRILSYVNGALSTMAMLDYPYASTFVTPMPPNPVKYACDRLSSDPSEILQNLKTATDVFLNFTGQLACYDASLELLSAASLRRGMLKGPGLGSIDRPWNYQACAELVLEPLTSNGNGFFVPQTDTDVEEVVAACRDRFGVEPRQLWLEQAFGNGAQLVANIKNTIFSDGDKVSRAPSDSPPLVPLLGTFLFDTASFVLPRIPGTLAASPTTRSASLRTGPSCTSSSRTPRITRTSISPSQKTRRPSPRPARSSSPTSGRGSRRARSREAPLHRSGVPDIANYIASGYYI